MKIRITPRAQAQIAHQIGYIAEHGSKQAASKMQERIRSYIYDFLTHSPKVGKYIKEKGIHEAPIPRTKYVLFYRLEEPNILNILALFHGAQDRSNFTSSSL